MGGPFPSHLSPTPSGVPQQQLFSPQMPSSLPQPRLPPSMGLSVLSEFGVTDPPSSIFSPFSPPPPPPPQTYFDPQRNQHGCYDNNDAVNPTRTPPPEAQFPLVPPDVPGGPSGGQLTMSQMFHFPLKRDPSSESLKSPHRDFVTPSSGGPSPTNHPLTNPEYNSRSQYGFVSPGQPGNDVTMDTTQQHPSVLSRQISSDVLPALDSGQRSVVGEALGGMAMHMGAGGVVSEEGGSGGILGSKRKDGSLLYLPSKRRSPYNSQSDLPLWMEEGLPGGSAPSMPPPYGPAPLSSRRASIGSAAQLSDRPVLQKNKSEPSGSLLLKVCVYTLFTVNNRQWLEVLNRYTCVCVCVWCVCVCVRVCVW